MSSDTQPPPLREASSSRETASEKTALLMQVATTAQTFFATARPWRQLVDYTAFKRPSSFRDATVRVKRNIIYFRVNYAMIVIAFVFISLLWEPYSLMVYAAVLVAWFYLYFFRDEPLEVCGHTLDDRVVLIGLFSFTVFVLLVTSVWLNLFSSIVMAAMIVVVHGTFRNTVDIYVDDEEGIGVEGFVSSTIGSLSASGYTRV